MKKAEDTNETIELKLIDSVYDILDRRFKQLVKVVLDEVESGGDKTKIKQKIWDIKDLLANDFLSSFSKRIKHRLDDEE
ncbi:MAG: hypothetical protein Q7R49_05660, partial [Candidatus Daviesbacteria bacterium]|nr:hypothetical protein [Candidatus Daviesbacteria bacterium]